MRIANWNLERVLPAQSRVSVMQDHFAAIDADIWILTETHELVGPGDGFSSVMSGEPDRESKPGECWAGIWSRHPIKHLPSFVSDMARCTVAHITDPDIGEIVVHATVLPWVGSKWGGIESADGAAFEAALGAYVSDWKKFVLHFRMRCALLPATSTKTSHLITTMARKSSANFLNQGSLQPA